MHKISLECDEGLHRKSGIIQAIMRSPIDDTTICIAGYGQFKLKQFAHVGIVPEFVLT